MKQFLQKVDEGGSVCSEKNKCLYIQHFPGPFISDKLDYGETFISICRGKKMQLQKLLMLLKAFLKYVAI